MTAYYTEILNRMYQRIGTLKSQNAGLIAILLASVSLVAAGAFYYYQSEQPLSTWTYTVVLIFTGLSLISLLMALHRFDPKGYWELAFTDDEFERHRGMDESTFLENQLYWTQKVVVENYVRYSKWAELYVWAVRLFKAAVVILAAGVLARVIWTNFLR